MSPESKIVIRNTQALTVSIVVGLPWQDQTVVLDGLDRKLYENQEWVIADSTLRLINTTTYGWEPNVFAHNNVLIIKNSNFTGSSVNSDNGRYIISNSTLGIARAQEEVEMSIRDSTVAGDVIATDNSAITLINTVVKGRIIEQDNGRVIVR